MDKQTRQAVCAALLAIYLLLWGAFAPVQGRAAWWCTAFGVTCGETAGNALPDGRIEFRSRLLDWLHGV